MISFLISSASSPIRSVISEGCMDQVLKQVTSKVLGPVMKVEVTTPNQFQTQVIQLISSRHGQISDQDETMEFTTYQCEVQLYDMFGFTADLRQCTEGKGEFTMEFTKYDYARDEIETALQQEARAEAEERAQAAKKG